MREKTKIEIKQLIRETITEESEESYGTLNNQIRKNVRDAIKDIIRNEINGLRDRIISLEKNTGNDGDLFLCNPFKKSDEVIPDNKDLNERLKKVEKLTNASDYEYITETKLIKKQNEKSTS